MRGESNTTIIPSSLGAPSQPLIHTMFLNICDLPESLLVEILSRLPCKFVTRCKCVCKSWSTLISLPYFESRRALYHRDLCDKEQTTMLLRRHSYHYESEYFTIDTKPELRALDFHPGKTQIVEATYNHLILLRVDDSFEYYICNPYTKQWAAIPPPTNISFHNIVGFICDSDYRCRIVRLLETNAEPDPQLQVEIFSSETGKWTKSVVICPQRFRLFDVESNKAAFANHGTLYWSGCGGFLIGLDPFSKLDNNQNYHCQYISEPNPSLESNNSHWVGVCQDCVRMCEVTTLQGRLSVNVWELKQEDDDGVGGKQMKWRLKESVILDSIINPFSYRYWLLALDPNEEDILYLERSGRNYDACAPIIFACNIRTKTVIDIRKKLFDTIPRQTFPYMLPCRRCPAPVPKLENWNNSSSCPPEVIVKYYPLSPIW